MTNILYATVYEIEYSVWVLKRSVKLNKNSQRRIPTLMAIESHKMLSKVSFLKFNWNAAGYKYRPRQRRP